MGHLLATEPEPAHGASGRWYSPAQTLGWASLKYPSELHSQSICECLLRSATHGWHRSSGTGNSSEDRLVFPRPLRERRRDQDFIQVPTSNLGFELHFQGMIRGHWIGQGKLATLAGRRKDVGRVMTPCTYHLLAGTSDFTRPLFIIQYLDRRGLRESPVCRFYQAMFGGWRDGIDRDRERLIVFSNGIVFNPDVVSDPGDALWYEHFAR